MKRSKRRALNTGLEKNFSIKKLQGIFIILLLVSPFILTPRLIKVSVECESQFGRCPESIKSKLEFFNQKNYSSAKKGIKRVLMSDSLVNDFSIYYKLPGTLKVNIIVKKPGFIYKNLASGKGYLIGRNGEVLMESGDSALSVVAGDYDPKVGEFVSPQILFALNLQEGVLNLYGVNTGIINRNTLVVELKDQVRVTFPLQGDVEILLGSLRVIYTRIQSGEDSKKFSEIDLRFKNPVLR